MHIRTLQADDANALLAFETANRGWFERHVEARAPEFYTLPGVALHIAIYLDDHRQRRLHPCVLLDDDGNIVGRANLRHIDRRAGVAEVGYRIGRAHTGRGLASAALAHLQRLAREQWQLTRLQAWVADENPASARVIEKAGFHRVSGMPPHRALVHEELRNAYLYECALLANHIPPQILA